MGVSYVVSQSGLRVDAYPEGVLTVSDSIDYFNRLNRDAAIQPGAVEYVDFKKVTGFNTTEEDARGIVLAFRETQSARGLASTVFVCQTDIAFGMCRWMAAHLNMLLPDYPVVVVRSEEELKTCPMINRHYGTNSNPDGPDADQAGPIQDPGCSP